MVAATFRAASSGITGAEAQEASSREAMMRHVRRMERRGIEVGKDDNAYQLHLQQSLFKKK